MIELANRTDCMGCKACGDACPVNAIKFSLDEKDFWHPSINHATCIECGKCVNACVILKTSQSDLQKDVPAVYSAYSTERLIREKSTSGGLFFELSAQVIRSGGVVCACRFSEDYRASFHTFAENMEELEPLLGSKYFQSDTAGVYRKIRVFLEKGRSVMFSGAPCQSAALQQYLPEKLRGNLLTVDFVCLGINSPKGYGKFIDELEERYGAKVQKVRFKDKSRGWLNLGTKIAFQNGQEYYGSRYNDAWVNSYIGGKFMVRASCAVCRFKELPRISDITIGDFWGGKYTPDERKYGVSLVMVNSQKGEHLFDAIKPRLVFRAIALDVARASNRNMDHCVSLNPKEQEIFFKRLENEKFSKVVWTMLQMPAWKRYMRRYAALLRSCVKRITCGK